MVHLFYWFLTGNLLASYLTNFYYQDDLNYHISSYEILSLETIQDEVLICGDVLILAKTITACYSPFQIINKKMFFVLR